MMKRYWLRSIIFNICFYGMTALACVAALPSLFLPRSFMMWVVRTYLGACYFIEKHILGLDYEIRGAEHLPKDGSYIIAAKHQSAYETLKLHKLFGDPAIILKKELLSLPLWGQYLKKSDVIAIDRSTPDAAIKSIQDGAQRVAAQGRPIVIFPQGTRVAVGDKKRYRIGVARVQEATGLPIIPLALNTGYFWPRNSFIKRPGKVIFELLPPIMPGKTSGEILAHLESEIEGHSDALIEEAKTKKTRGAMVLPLLLLVALIYSALWFGAAEQMTQKYLTGYSQNGITRISSPPQISGFPGAITLSNEREEFRSANGAVAVNNISITSWPLPGTPVKITMGAITITDKGWSNPLRFTALRADILMRNNVIQITDGALQDDDMRINVSGLIDLDPLQNGAPYPDAALDVAMDNPEHLLMQLARNDILPSDQARMAAAGISSFQGADKRALPLRLEDGMIYIGPFRLARLP